MFETENLPNHWVEIGSLVVAIIGISALFIQLLDIKKTVRIQSGQLKAQDEQLKAQTLSALYGHYFYYCRALLEKPHLRPYMYEALRLDSEPADPVRRAEVQTLCELLTGVLEQAEVQKKNLPGDSWKNCWAPLMRDMYKNPEAEMAQFYRSHAHFYSMEFRGAVENLLESKA